MCEHRTKVKASSRVQIYLTKSTINYATDQTRVCYELTKHVTQNLQSEVNKKKRTCFFFVMKRFKKKTNNIQMKN